MGRTRSFVRTRLPWISAAWRGLASVLESESAARRRAFRRVYEENAWGSAESRSGPGSTLARTARLRAELPAVLAELSVRSLLDAPCGDCHWMRHVAAGLDRYVGVDIVPELVEANRREAAAPGREFLVADLVRDRLPRADAILCRECLGHLTLADGVRALENFRRSGARWLLATTFRETRENLESPTGGWRPVNLERPPYDLPPPVRLVSERIADHPDKALGVWRIGG